MPKSTEKISHYTEISKYLSILLSFSFKLVVIYTLVLRSITMENITKMKLKRKWSITKDIFSYTYYVKARNRMIKLNKNHCNKYVI